jgi:hypothetical protein
LQAGFRIDVEIATAVNRKALLWFEMWIVMKD